MPLIYQKKLNKSLNFRHKHMSKLFCHQRLNSIDWWIFY